MGWTRPSGSERVFSPPSGRGPTPLQYTAPLELNTEALTPTNFEKLIVALIQAHEQAAVAYIYGEPGQRQNGIDVIAQVPGGMYHSYQAKRYQRFSKAALQKAVATWRAGGRPYSSSKFVLAVSCPVRRTEILDERRRLSEQEDIDIEIWDKLTLSNYLRDFPSLVAQFFGVETARVFFPYFEKGERDSLSRVAASTADAVVRGPLRALDLAKAYASATTFEKEAKYESAAELYESIADRLMGAGFAVHARIINVNSLTARLQAGLLNEAAPLALDIFWSAFDDFSSLDDVRPCILRLAGALGNIGEQLQSEVAVAQAIAYFFTSSESAALEAGEQAVASLPRDLRAIKPAAVFLEVAMTGTPFEASRALMETCHALLSVVGAFDEDPLYTFRLGACLAQLGEDWNTFSDEIRRQLPPMYTTWLLARRARAAAFQDRQAEAERLYLDAVERACINGTTRTRPPGYTLSRSHGCRRAASTFPRTMATRWHGNCAAGANPQGCPAQVAYQVKPNEASRTAPQQGLAS